MKNMGVVMSLSGSIILVIYFILYPFSKRKFSIGWHRFIIIASIVYNIFPFPNFKYIMLDVISFIFPVSHQAAFVTSFTQDASIYIYNGGIMFSEKQKIILIIGGILITISLSILISQLGYYFYIKYIFLKKKVDYALCHRENLLLKKIATDLNIKHLNRIQIGKSSFISVPMVIGVWNPTIVIPTNVVFDDEELSFILRHELCHIKNHDLFWRFLGLFIIGIHWYNPLSYLLFAQYNRVSELFCDVNVTRDFEIKAKKRYCAFLIDLSTSIESKPKVLFSVGLLGYKKSKLLINQRISEVMKVKKCSKVLSSIAASVILLASSISVLAFDPPKIFKEGSDISTEEQSGELTGFFNMGYDPSLDGRFIDISGNVLPISDQKESKTCKHELQSGVVQRHYSHSDGSCQIVYYDSVYCTKCGYTETIKPMFSKDFNPCTH